MLLVEKSWSGVLLQKGKLQNCLSVLISKVSRNLSYVTDGVEASGDFSSRGVTSLQTEVILWKVALLPLQAFLKKILHPKNCYFYFNYSTHLCLELPKVDPF